MILEKYENLAANEARFDKVECNTFWFPVPNDFKVHELDSVRMHALGFSDWYILLLEWLPRNIAKITGEIILIFF